MGETNLREDGTAQTLASREIEATDSRGLKETTIAPSARKSSDLLKL